MVERNMFVKVFPYDTSYKELEAFKPDGYFISNGPGDPQPLKDVQSVAKKIIKNNKPLFGICLGHQIIALANGIPTFKMFNGHRGINHPVKNMKAAKKNSQIEITHVHLNDGTLAGMRLKNKKCFSVQYHPEAGPGPNDATYLFDIFKKYLLRMLIFFIFYN